MSALLESHLALIFSLSVFALVGTLTLAGVVRWMTRASGRVVHLVTGLCGAGALAFLTLSTLGVDTGLGALAGLAAGGVSVLFWLAGAAVARARPVWVDMLVIVAALAYFTAYAQMPDQAGGVPPVFSGVALAAPTR
ncbi:MAG: hypothetical protein RIB61_13280 [Roseicyclus sp.]